MWKVESTDSLHVGTFYHKELCNHLAAKGQPGLFLAQRLEWMLA